MQLSRPDTLKILKAMSDRISQLPASKPHVGRVQQQINSILQKQTDLLTVTNEDSLNIQECAQLSLDMEELARKLPAGNTLAELSQRLALLAQAAWAQLAKSVATNKLFSQFKHFDRPGASSEKKVGVSVGAGLGFGADKAGGKATFSVGLEKGWRMDNDDEGFVFRNKTAAATFSAKVKGGIGIVSAALSGNVEAQKTRFTEYRSAMDFVQSNTEQLMQGSRSNTPGASSGRFRPGRRNELKRHRRLLQQAVDQQQRLNLLLGWIGLRDASPALRGSHAPVVPVSVMVRVKGEAKIQAAAVGGHAAATLSLVRMNIHQPVLTPFWQALSTQEGVARSSSIAAQRLGAIAKNAGQLFDSDNDKVGTRPLSRLIGSEAGSPAELRNCSPNLLQHAANRLKAELEHFCAVAQLRDASKDKGLRAEKIEKSIISSWQGKKREDVLANMALAHVTLLIETKECGNAPEAEQVLKEIAEILASPPIRHDAEALSTRVAFRDTLELQIRDRIYALELGGNLGGNLGMKVEASLTERHRIHINPMRDGDYKDVRVTLSGNLGGAGGLDKLKEALAAQLLPHGLADQLPSALQSVETELAGTLDSGVTLLLRFYRPRYQLQEGFPQAAAGFHLQLARITSDSNASGALSAGIPLQPGVSLALGLRAGGTVNSVLYERWGDNSLTAPMMHYLHLQQVGEPERWQDMVAMQQPALKGLFRQLARLDSAVRKEAGHFLKHQAQDGFEEKFFATMQDFSSGKKSFDDARILLDELMLRQLPLWRKEKAAFHGWVEQAVSV
ncbi:hypothetical protein E5C26_20205 [Serratia proteamaculans]|uniref:hypothetical protein n=1 Tax=Serratia proteamaculans TaxID=28151 RepID=UPI0010765C3B|nr:hypothetical protein [Serratia proteamaculans]TFZ48666.1 hypothetical protein E5C26_20205 [Serratia proteamaculans]